MSDTPELDRAYALQTPDDSRALYSVWASTYDADFMETTQYILHLNVVSAFVAAGGRGPVLDVGAGTGACGEALAQHGVGPVHGTDISPEMLDVAVGKGVYETVFPGDILEGLDAIAGRYTGIVSAGTFTLGHVGPDGLDEVVRLLSSGGLAVISVRDAHYEATGFDAKLRELEPALHPVTATKTRIYREGADVDHANDMAILLHLTKR